MYVFPVHLFNPKGISAAPVPKTISGGAALTGDEDIVATDGGGRWEIEFSEISLVNPDLVRAWDAWITYLDAGAVPCLVPLVTLSTAPRPYADANPLRAPPLVANDRLWPTSVAYSTPYIEAEFTDDADLRATTVALDVTLGGVIRGGENFSVGERAYRILRPGGVAGEYIVRPPLRAAVAVGAAVNFNWPTVKCRLDPTSEIPTVALRYSAETAIRFVECD